MTISEETLMAYVDGELDAKSRSDVQAAMAADPEVAERAARHEALRLKAQAAFRAVLDEPVPERLLSAARTAPTGVRGSNVRDLAHERAVRAESQHPASRAQGSWTQWGAIAASLIAGLIIGQHFLPRNDGAPFATRAGGLFARNALAQALSTQLASNQLPGSAVQIGLSFRTHSGEYCRTFALAINTGSDGSLAGLACHEHGEWRVDMLVPSESGASNAYRMAGTQLPKAVMQAVEDGIAGEPLDASGERTARDNDWRPRTN
jgi:hypothetical protein